MQMSPRILAQFVGSLCHIFYPKGYRKHLNQPIKIPIIQSVNTDQEVEIANNLYVTYLCFKDENLLVFWYWYQLYIWDFSVWSG